LFSFQIKGPESTTTRTAGGLDFTAIGGKRQGARSDPIVENNAVEPGALNDHTAL